MKKAEMSNEQFMIGLLVLIVMSFGSIGIAWFIASIFGQKDSKLSMIDREMDKSELKRLVENAVAEGVARALANDHRILDAIERGRVKTSKAIAEAMRSAVLQSLQDPVTVKASKLLQNALKLIDDDPELVSQILRNDENA